jgi:hypothetical protein
MEQREPTLYGVLYRVRAKRNQYLGGNPECKYYNSVRAYQYFDVALRHNPRVGFRFIEVHQFNDAQVVKCTHQREKHGQDCQPHATRV